MRRHRAHFFFRPQMNRQIGDVLFQDMAQPAFPFVDMSIAEACLDADRQSAHFRRLDNFRRVIGVIDQAAAFSFGGNVRYGTAHINVDAFKALRRHANAHLAEMLGLIAPDMGDDRLFIFRERQAPAHAVDAFRVAIAFRIRKFREIHVRARRFRYHMAKHHIRHVFHRRQYKKWLRQFTPKIFFHSSIPILSLRDEAFLHPKIHYHL